MATTVTNRTRKPLSIPLGRGKKLYLGPGMSGEIAANDIEDAAVKALVENGAIEIVKGRDRTAAGGGGKGGRPSQGHMSGGGSRRSGDR
ncbi:MAG: hypothetical protein E4H03_05845 [Myxococcales bacterium]|jgi:hypothetical protein|nr:MAG: hypothetical protein E4H03_05845 [Myxococcales bacterium]